VQQHQHVVDAAKQAGVRHIVYTSALNPTPNSFFTGAASHLATEHYLQESGLTYTIFRNTLYLDVLPDFIGAQTLASGQLYAATGTGKVSYALREEIAQALATVLTESGHENQTYDIAPGPAYSMQDIAATLSEVTG
jgi:NAD(P)H dehydrogenase (quinone)